MAYTYNPMSGDVTEITYNDDGSIITTTNNGYQSIKLPSGQILTSSAGGSSLSAILSNYVPLSKEESKELEDLRSEHTRKEKLAKIEIFKKLPKGLRQQVVDKFLWDECVEQMNSMQLDKDQKLIDLEKKSLNSLWGGTTITLGGNGISWNHVYTGTPFTLPKDFTAEDLKRAHMEATLEEEVFNEQSTGPIS